MKNSVRRVTGRILGLVALSALLLLVSFASNRANCLPDASAQTLTAGQQLDPLEDQVFGKRNSGEPLIQRLSKIEIAVYGRVQGGTLIERLSALQSFLSSGASSGSPSGDTTNDGAGRISRPADSAGMSDTNAKSAPLQGNVSQESAVFSAETSPAHEYCGQWSGSWSGNDPDVHVEMTLTCLPNSALKGVVHTSSPRSGSDTRQVTGLYDASLHVVVLRDDDVANVQSKKGWTHCAIERYKLHVVDEHTLEGQYWSRACHDHGVFKVQRVASQP